MGIDIDVFTFSSKNMIDQRAQFYRNRWFANQVNDQLNSMNATSNLNGVDSPLAFEATQPMRPFADFGHSSTNRLLSDSRSNSTDTSFDPTPDGPEMENGKDNCLSPEMASPCSFAEYEADNYYPSIGTPNSFVGKMPGSPDMFSDFEQQRERLLSTSSSAFTYSPYTPQEEDPIPLGQSCSSPPALNRQTSLAMVEEVLGTTNNISTQPMNLFPEEDYVKPLEEDSCLPPYPSPSFTAHFNSNNSDAEVLTASQGEEFYHIFCGEVGPILVQCEGSPATESNQSNNNNCNNGDSQNVQSPVTQEVITTSETPTQALLQPPVWSMSRQPSNFSDLITDSMPSNSLDASEMLQDCLNALPKPDAQTFQTLNIEVLAVEAPLSEPAVNVPSIDEQLRTSPKSCTSPLCVKENSSPNTSKNLNECDPLAARRERNNEACRQSRKRRKSKKVEMEHEVNRFTEENASLRVTIEELEVECKRMKQSILTVMTQNNSR
uniref:uncharacterized protein LOC120341964 isoform X1 n=2 Tax=Styela clava TaxID=7725 RepID=UPI0019392B77|nr:uncharacterized protein LOC120341964 isoform X1 [Styela clava]